MDENDGEDYKQDWTETTTTDQATSAQVPPSK